ncbi:MAG: NADH-quinone oxidoreductase subunit C [Planctomycetota bacterium]|nr:NADH-quinone oxidoreductase subunit C [Planctomycetota bacterium]
MTPTQIAQALVARFGPAITKSLPQDKHPRVHTIAEHWRAIAEFLRHEPTLDFDWLSCLTAIDYVADNQLCAAYELWSTRHGHSFAVKVYVDRARPMIPSVMDLWPAADWHEREAYDLMGIDFTGHGDLRRILLPEDWVGHPLRKDYVFPREYHGIPGTTELDWQQKPNYPK